jgi:hypothetical protein
VREAALISFVIQSRRQYGPTEIIGNENFWIGASLTALFVGLIMWQAGLLFWFPLMLAAMIFLVGGAIVVMRGEPVFILMYFMFVIIGAGGLIVTANLSPIAKDLYVDAVPVSLLGMTLPALTFAATIEPVLNGLTRPFFGWISNNVGRENTTFIAFMPKGIGIYALCRLGANPFWFVFAIRRGFL